MYNSAKFYTKLSKLMADNLDYRWFIHANYRSVNHIATKIFIMYLITII